MITIDFETMPIDGNPVWKPPKPIGVAYWIKGTEPTYVTAWDHDKQEYIPEGWDAMCRLWHLWMDSGDELLFHNAPFDLSVGLKWLGGQIPDWTRVHDTLFLLFLADPHSDSLSLKPSSERYLDLPAEEQDELHEWILANVPEATPKNAGAYIYRAPLDLVSRYAKGDVVRTRGLYDRLIDSYGGEAYDRERRLMPKLMQSSRQGIRVDRGRLEEDLRNCEGSLTTVDQRIFEVLKCEPFNLGSGFQLADKLDQAGLVDEWILTPKGRRSTSKPNLMKVCKDPHLINLLAYRSTMQTCVGTFMKPWLEFSSEDGRVHTEWNQVANDEGRHQGTRTGRLSSGRPNFQNPPNPFGLTVPDGLAPLPIMRSYLLPEEGHIWIKRDFSSQEVRLLAHFAEGLLMQQYQKDPFFDPHSLAQEIIKDITGVLFERKDVKITAFSTIYGAGVPGLAQQLNRPRSEAAMLREAYFKAIPAVPKIAASTRNRGTSGQGIITWGGRHYLAERPKMIGGRMRTFEYKLLNYLIQGSAGDQTKQVICDWWEEYKHPETVFTSTIHDEVNASAPIEIYEQEMKQLRLAMDQDYFDVPMRSEGSYGPNWGSLTDIPIEDEYEV